MSAGRSKVDLGLVAMQVGEGRAPQAQPERIDARVDDVARLAALLERPRSPGQQGQSREHAAAMQTIVPVDAGTASLARQLGELIGRLWVGNGSRSEREVRARLDDAILPETWLRMVEVGGRLQIELSTGRADVHEWLRTNIGRLAEEIGQRLKRPLRVLAVGSDAMTRASLDWPEGRQHD
ncbi:MAG: hypothetical protein JWP36_2327 [Paucimonas sp.]|nr:hypothetical protein [Paucimonas sp.]